jgi:hypothetical protein
MDFNLQVTLSRITQNGRCIERKGHSKSKCKPIETSKFSSCQSRESKFKKLTEKTGVEGEVLCLSLCPMLS